MSDITIGTMNPQALRTVIVGLEQAVQKSEEGLHVSAAVLAGWAFAWLEDIIKTARLEDYEAAIRRGMVEPREDVVDG